MEAITFIGLLALITKVVTIIKAIGKNNNMVITQLLVWGVGFGILLLAANAEISSGFSPFPGHTLGSLDVASLLLASMMTGSTGSVVYDFKKARDNSDTAAEPSLVPALTTQNVV